MSRKIFIFVLNFLADEETEFKKHGDKLIIRKVNRSFSGEYTCRAFQISEIMTNVEEQTVRLNVHCKHDELDFINET